MKILMVHPHDLFSKAEPWTTRIRNIAKQFKKNSHEVRVVYFPLVNRENEQIFYADGIEFIPLSRQVGKGNFLKNIRFFIKESKWADVIHFQKCFHYAALPVLIGGFLNKKPLHYDWDDWEIKIFHYCAKQPWLTGVFLGALERFIPLLCDTISVSSLRLKQECLRYGINEKLIFMAPVGADLELFHPRISPVRIRERYNIDSPLISYIGQLHGGQYAEQFIKAAKIVLNSIRDITFMIVGGGYRLEELKTLAAVLDIDEHIIFTDSVAHQEVPLFMAAADIAIACFEDNDITRCKSPLKIAEYMACGKPIVASNVGEVINMLGGAAVITEPDNPEDLARGIIKLLEDEPLRKRLSVKARQRAEEIYNWKNTTENLLRAYRYSLGVVSY
ncbi:MAG: glycosyltransferase family 4 protein [Candidatus Omnitrophica bacterium]|nr:glycosyltransferase family 4 protein [Candidatus Omnitrophota bacterium]